MDSVSTPTYRSSHCLAHANDALLSCITRLHPLVLAGPLAHPAAAHVSAASAPIRTPASATPVRPRPVGSPLSGAAVSTADNVHYTASGAGARAATAEGTFPIRA